MALKRRRAAEVLVAAAMIAGCASSPRQTMHLLSRFESVIPIPAGFLPPPAPPDNPLTLEKIELGRYLFYDRRLSLNGTQSCASCHRQQFGFADRQPRAIGSTGQEHARNSMGLANVAYRRPLTWTNRNIDSLEEQVLVPLLGRKPVELGFGGREEELLRRLRDDTRYRTLFAAAFPQEREPITVQNLARAIASFERSLLSGAAPFDRFLALGESDALSESALRGAKVFFSASAGCASCHGGRDFVTPAGGSVFQNNGLSGAPFRVPSLRNVAATPPYMHDGSIAELAKVIDDYASVRRLNLDAAQKRDLLAFLESLVDAAFLSDERFSDPWK